MACKQANLRPVAERTDKNNKQDTDVEIEEHFKDIFSSTFAQKVKCIVAVCSGGGDKL